MYKLLHIWATPLIPFVKGKYCLCLLRKIFLPSWEGPIDLRSADRSGAGANYNNS